MVLYDEPALPVTILILLFELNYLTYFYELVGLIDTTFIPLLELTLINLLFDVEFNDEILFLLFE